MIAATLAAPVRGAADAVIRAHDIIARYGFRQVGFGDHPIGFSVEGAIFEACGMRASDLDLHNPATDDDQRRWDAAMAAIRAVAEHLDVHVPSRQYGAVCDWSEQGDRDRAVVLLRRVWGRLMTAGGAT